MYSIIYKLFSSNDFRHADISSCKSMYSFIPYTALVWSHGEGALLVEFSLCSSVIGTVQVLWLCSSSLDGESNHSHGSPQEREVNKITLVNWQCGERVVGEEGGWGGHEGSEGSSLVKDKEGDQGILYLERGSHCGVSDKPGARETPRKLQRWPQLRP